MPRRTSLLADHRRTDQRVAQTLNELQLTIDRTKAPHGGTTLRCHVSKKTHIPKLLHGNPLFSVRPDTMTFLPKDFLFGFATAAAQIEGGGEEKEKASGRGLSVSPVVSRFGLI